ncbi:MAG: MaoC family dehydratase N-terminal domain-containing protein [Chloroflexota bacterium]
MPPKTVTYEDLNLGFEFPSSAYTLEPQTVAAYLKAVGEGGEAESGPTAVVPPAALAALAMRSLIAQLTLSPGSVQLSQDLEFLRPVAVGETVTCRAYVGKKQERAGLKMAVFELAVFNAAGDKVMAGRTLVGMLEKKV